MRVLAALTALAVAVAPGTEPHTVTLRFDNVDARQAATSIVLKAPVAGLHLSTSNAPAEQQIMLTTPASVVVDAGVDALMIDVDGNKNVRVSFESGGSQRELTLRITGSRMLLRRNADGDLVLGARVLPAPARP